MKGRVRVASAAAAWRRSWCSGVFLSATFISSHYFDTAAASHVFFLPFAFFYGLVYVIAFSPTRRLSSVGPAHARAPPRPASLPRCLSPRRCGF